MTGRDMIVIFANDFKRWHADAADGFGNWAACAKSAAGRRVYGAGQIAAYRRLIDALTGVDAQAGRD